MKVSRVRTLAVAVRDGYMEVPQQPSLGIRVNESDASKHAYGPDHFLRLFQSRWEGRKGESKHFRQLDHP